MSTIPQNKGNLPKWDFIWLQDNYCILQLLHSTVINPITRQSLFFPVSQTYSHENFTYSVLNKEKHTNQSSLLTKIKNQMIMVTHNIEIFMFISLLIFHFKQRGYNVHLLSQLSYTFSFNSKVKCQWCGSNVLNKSGKKSNVIWLFHYMIMRVERIN